MGRTARPRGMRGGSVKSTWSEMQQLRNRVRDLEQMRERLSRLYFSQVETGKARMEKLHRILEVVTRLNSSLDIDSLLGADRRRGAEEPRLPHRAAAHPRPADGHPARARLRRPVGRGDRQLEAQDVPLDDVPVVADGRVPRQPLVLHQPQAPVQPPAAGRRRARPGRARGLGVAPEDVLLVPLYTRDGRAHGVPLGGRSGRPARALPRDHRDARDLRQPRRRRARERAPRPVAGRARPRARGGEPAHGRAQPAQVVVPLGRVARAAHAADLDPGLPRQPARRPRPAGPRGAAALRRHPRGGEPAPVRPDRLGAVVLPPGPGQQPDGVQALGRARPDRGGRRGAPAAWPRRRRFRFRRASRMPTSGSRRTSSC